MTDGAKLEVLLEGPSFPEGPRRRNDRLWFSDFYTDLVQTHDFGGLSEASQSLPRGEHFGKIVVRIA